MGIQPVAISRSSTGSNYAAAASGIADTAVAVTINAAAGEGQRNYVTSSQLEHATLGASTEFAIRDGVAGPVLWRCALKTAAMAPLSIVFPSPLAGSPDTLLEVVTLTAVTGGVYVNARGYSAP